MNAPMLANPQAGALSLAPRQYLTFSLASETFAVVSLAVREIIEYGDVTTVPMMPSFIRGVINLRGSVVPVVDLGIRFRQTPTEVNRRSCIVILEIPQGDAAQVLGIIVDTVNEVLEIAPEDVEPAPAFGASIRTEFIAGMAKVDAGFVILLDVAKALSIEEMTALTHVVAQS